MSTHPQNAPKVRVDPRLLKTFRALSDSTLTIPNCSNHGQILSRRARILFYVDEKSPPSYRPDSRIALLAVEYSQIPGYFV